MLSPEQLVHRQKFYHFSFPFGGPCYLGWKHWMMMHLLWTKTSSLASPGGSPRFLFPFRRSAQDMQRSTWWTFAPCCGQGCGSHSNAVVNIVEVIAMLWSTLWKSQGCCGVRCGKTAILSLRVPSCNSYLLDDNNFLYFSLYEGPCVYVRAKQGHY